jgi:hypothetical protein
VDEVDAAGAEGAAEGADGGGVEETALRNVDHGDAGTLSLCGEW